MIDKVKIARSFSRSAETYDQVAYFQRDMGLELMDLLEKVIRRQHADNTQKRCMDLGCGTGFFQEKIQSLYAHVEYVGLDLAEGMLHHIQSQAKNKESRYLICGDAENLPLADESIDCIFSNMALQWCEKLDQLFTNIYRILNEQGLLAFTTLGPDTLHELKMAWSNVDNLVHVNHFVNFDEWKRAIDLHDFTVESCESKRVILEYASVRTLLQELKLLGAHNVNDGQRKTLTGRRRLQALLNAYPFSENQRFYPATYEVYFWVLRKK